MAQKKLIVSDIYIDYDGLFDCAELFRLMDDWFKQHNYEKVEVKHVERVKEKGKFIDYEVMPGRKLSDYARSDLNVRTIITDMKDVEIKKDGKKIKLNKGHINIDLCAFLVTDVYERWEHKPLFFFLRTLYDKFINRQFTEQYEEMIAQDLQILHTELKSYLNLSRYTTQS